MIDRLRNWRRVTPMASGRAARTAPAGRARGHRRRRGSLLEGCSSADFSYGAGGGGLGGLGLDGLVLALGLCARAGRRSPDPAATERREQHDAAEDHQQQTG